jgi:uncharacterized membrane protein
MNWKIVFILIFAANLALGLISYAILPDRIAIHFGSGGIPDSWGPKSLHLTLFTFVDILLFLLMYYTPRIVLIFPPRFVNLPNRNYWLQDSKREEMTNRLNLLMWEYGSALFAFLFLAQLFVLQANLSQPVRLDETSFLIALGIFMIYTVFWIIKLYRKFRIPSEQPLT